MNTSTTVEERVLEMQFDNKQFERNVQTSMSSIESLKKSLDMNGVAKSFDSINDASRRTDLSGLGSAVDTVRIKFSALEIMAVTALMNITNSAINMGKKVASALTIDPVKSGFTEYETQINAVQTILANTSSKGTNLNQVNAALNELNHYADLTIYNFTEMTRNIGTFTAAGIDLNTSVSAIKGIANLAAVSGSTSQQASTAMYQLSQALASGTVKLQDWNSVVNAGMGGQVFQDALKSTARIHGINIDKMIDKEGSFRETLKDGWLTSSILTETLSKFTGDLNEEQLKSMSYTDDQIKEIIKMGETANDAATKVKTFTQLIDTLAEAAQSGWTASWQTIIGDFEESKALFTEISNVLSDMINSSSESRNDLLKNALSSEWSKFASTWTGIMGNGAGGLDVFKEKIIEVAKEQGVAIDEMIENSGSFESSLKEGWLSSDIMSKSMDKLTTSISELSDEELKEIGYSRELVDTLVEFNTEVQNGEQYLGDFTSGLDGISGREHIIQALRNSFYGFLELIKPIKEAFEEIFPPITAMSIYKFAENLSDITSKFKLTDDQSNKLKRTFKGLFAVLDIGKQALSGISTGLKPLLKLIPGIGDGILGVTANIGDWLVALNESAKEGEFFQGIATKIATGLEFLIGIFKDFKEVVKIKFDFPEFELLNGIIDRIKMRFSGLTKVFDSFKEVFSSGLSVPTEDTNLVDVTNKITTSVSESIYKLKEIISTNFEGIKKSLKNIKFDQVIDIINTAFSGGIAGAITYFIISVTKSIGEIGNAFESIVGVLDSVRGTFEAYQSKLKAEILIKIAGAIAILTAAIVVLSLIDSVKLGVAMASITGLFVDLVAATALVSKISGSIGNVAKTSSMMIAMSAAILLLASALKNISTIDSDKLRSSMIALSVIMGELMVVSYVLSQSSGNVMKGATQMLVFGLALKIVASVCKDISEMKPEQLKMGLLGVSALMAGMAGLTLASRFGGNMAGIGAGLLLISGALKVMSGVISELGKLNEGQIKQGLISIGILLVELASFSAITSKLSMGPGAGAGIILLSGAIMVLSVAIGSMGRMDLQVLAKGIIGIGAALGVISVAMRALPKSGMITSSAGITIVAAALLLISDAMKGIGTLGWDGLAVALVGIAGAMAVLVIALNAMNGTLTGSAALVIASAALTLLTPALMGLATLGLTGIATALLGLAGVFVVLGVAGAVLGPITPVILALGAAMLLIGGAVLAFGVGLTAAGAGIAAIAAGFLALSSAASAGSEGVIIAITTIATGIAEVIPLIAAKIAEGIISFAQTIAEGASKLAESATTVVLAIMKSIGETGPVVIETITNLLTTLLETLAANTPRVIQAGVDTIIALLEGIRDAIPRIIKVSTEIMIAFMEGIAESVPDLIDAGWKMIIDFINGLTEAIDANTQDLVDAINNLTESIIDAAIVMFKDSGVTKFTEAGTDLVDGLILGVRDKLTDVATAAAEIGTTALDSIKSVLSIHSPSKKTKTLGGFTGDGFINGLKDKFSGVSAAGTGLGNAAMDGAAKGIKDGSGKTKKAAKEAAKSIYDTTKEWIDEQKYYSKLSLQEELEAWQNLQAQYKEGSNERKDIDRQVYRVQNEIISDAFSKQKEWAEDKKYYDMMNIDEEFRYWKGIQEQYIKGSKERIEADKKVYQLSKEFAKSAYEEAVSWIDDRKYYDELSLNEELYAWEQIQKHYAEGSEERIKADKEIYRIEKSIAQYREDYEQKVLEVEEDAVQQRIELEESYYTRVSEINEQLQADIDALNKAYDDAVKSRSDSIYKSFNLWDYAAINENVEGQVLLDNLESQIVALEDWQKDINGLADRGIADGLLEELQAMGPSSAAEIKALNSLTDEQLSQYAALWQQKHDIATNQAISELENMRLETADQIAQLNEATATQLDELKILWDEQLAEINSNTANQLSKLRAEFDEQVGSISDETERTVDELSLNIQDTIAESNEAVVALMDTLAEDMQTSMNKPDWIALGHNIIMSMEKGILDKAKTLAETAARVAREALEAVEDELGIASPSKEFRRIGRQCDEGLAGGLLTYADLVKDGATKVGNGAIETMKNTISAIADSMNSDMEQPTIRPVLDLTDVTTGLSTLDNRFSSMRALSVSVVENKNRNSSDEIQNRKSVDSDTRAPILVNQTINSPKALSSAEIYRNTKNLFSTMERAGRV